MSIVRKLAVLVTRVASVALGMGQAGTGQAVTISFDTTGESNSSAPSFYGVSSNAGSSK